MGAFGKVRWLVAASLLSSMLVAQVQLAAPAAAATTVALPDLQSIIPPSGFSIVHPTSTTTEFRYTHDVADLGDAPLEIQPQYDPTTDTAIGYQNIFQRDANGNLSVSSTRRIVGQFIYHAIHGHYHYPLASFGLYQVGPNDTVGPPVVLSPKIGFCIGDSVQIDPNAGSATHHTDCTDPRALLGISQGWADEYDYRDAGQAIDATGLPNGTYWFRSIVDPDNYIQEKNEANNITDVKVTVMGDTVTVGETVHPDSTPPAVQVTTPTEGSVLSGSAVSLGATASAAPGIASVQFLLDGNPIGPVLTSPPFVASWDPSGATEGGHVLSARAIDTLGRRGTADAVNVSVSHASGGTVTLDRTVVADGVGTLNTPVASAPGGDTLICLIGSDGPAGSGAQSFAVSGGGLTWSLVRRSNQRPGSSEVWAASVPAAGLTNGTITTTPAASGFSQSVTLVALGNAAVGASNGAAAASGAPSVAYTASANGSWGFAVGNDWDSAVGRTLGPNQTMLHQSVLSTSGDTLWAQSTTSATGTAGVATVLNDTAPTNDEWNMAAVEVVPTGGGAPPPPPPPGPVVSNVFAGNRTSSSVTVSWTTDVPATSQIDYGPTSAYGSSTALDTNLVVNHAQTISGLQPQTTYHYRINSTDASNNTTHTADFQFSTAAISTLTCAITAPLAGATVSGTAVNVAADASSTASVTGVQFKLDGANLGAEDVSPPYAVTWDSTSATNAQHVLTAVVRDPTGNTMTCAPVTVTVNNGAPPPPPPPSGLVASYSFNQGSGSTLPDGSGSGNTGTIVGATWTTAGKYGGALSFNGSSSRVDIADSTSLHLTTGMTLEAWVKPTTLGNSWRTVLLKERPSGLCWGLYASTSSNRPGAYINSGGVDYAQLGSAALTKNAWSHLAETFDGTTLRIYVNGALVGSRAASGSMFVSNGVLRIGGNLVWGEWFAGLIDEVRVYNKALTASQITTDMNAALP